ncbi:AI-2E family transporter [Paracoccus sp. S3-43]|uniref:AI-2E family transporter n=1 Tax=Paracoccus sp. S3-43 TaxID=3030011 RepID=UPI0023B03C6A|nr:AI-2E family transporter [Paracoccus sp. S3-43]WEF23929.1 AI-2E family transporter [Paracoccus sp. S3-43]
MAEKFSFPRFRSDSSGASERAANWAVIGIFLIMAFAAIAAGRDFLMPVTLAALLFFVFTPLRRLARRRGVPDALTATAVSLGLVVAVALVALGASGPINQAARNLPTIKIQLEEKFTDLRESFAELQQAAEEIENVQAGGEDQQAVIAVEQNGDSPLTSLMKFTPAIAGQVVFTLFLLFFMLASGDLLYLKIVQSFDSMAEKRSAYLALRQIEDSLGNYLGAITIINAGLGLAVGLAMFAWGLPGALLFGIGAFILNFIPYLGAITGVVTSGVVALVVMPGIFWPLMVAGSYMLLTALEGQVITPYFVSRRLQMNTVVVFLAVALWAWLWSVIGMIIAVPVLVVLRVLADYVPGWEKFGNFLAGEDPPAIEDEDEEEARDIIEVGSGAEDEPAAREATAEVVPDVVVEGDAKP